MALVPEDDLPRQLRASFVPEDDLPDALRTRRLEEEKKKERTYGEAVKDIGAGVVSGAGALAQLPSQLYGLATGDFSDTGLMKVGKGIERQ